MSLTLIQGSNEGVVPDGAGDPLGHLPKSLRERCKVAGLGLLVAQVLVQGRVGGKGKGYGYSCDYSYSYSYGYGYSCSYGYS